MLRQTCRRIRGHLHRALMVKWLRVKTGGGASRIRRRVSSSKLTWKEDKIQGRQRGWKGNIWFKWRRRRAQDWDRDGQHAPQSSNLARAV